MDAPRYRVMVVDDDVQVARSLERLLRRRYEVTTAGSGEEALAKLESFEPDAVISDFRMPGMNGAELLALMKERRPNIRRIIMSGFSGNESDLLLERDSDQPKFLNKPWDCDELLEMVRALLEGG